MAYKMRRKKQQLPDEQAWDLLREGDFGILSLIDSEGVPYGVPLNYVLDGNTIYFHSALAGRKVDAIQEGSAGSFCVVALSELDPEHFSTNFRSVIAEGELSVISDEEEKYDALMKLALRFNPDIPAAKAEISSVGANCCMIALRIHTIAAKEAIELVRARESKVN